MLTKRIIPCLDVDAGRVVKGTSFIDIRDAGDPVELAALYDSEGGDELVFLDITASSDNRRTIREAVPLAAVDGIAIIERPPVAIEAPNAKSGAPPGPEMKRPEANSLLAEPSNAISTVDCKATKLRTAAMPGMPWE